MRIISFGISCINDAYSLQIYIINVIQDTFSLLLSMIIKLKGDKHNTIRALVQITGKIFPPRFVRM